MAIIAKKSEGKTFEPLAEGAYPARIYQIIHIGTIPGFQGALQNKVRITWEFPTEVKVFKEESGEQPQVLSNDYTLSFHEKSQLRKVIDACDPKALKTLGEDGLVEEYDIENLLGKSCLVTVVHAQSKTSEAVYANISNCTVMPKGMICPDQVNTSKSLSYDNFDNDYFISLPTFIQDKMRSSLEFKAMNEDLEGVPFPDAVIDIRNIKI